MTTAEASAPTSSRALAPRSRDAVLMPRWMLLVSAVVAQVVVALTVQELSVLALAHAAGLFGVGLYSLMKRDLGLLVCVLAYLTGSEVLWRQVGAPVFYLAAPYMMVVLSLFAVFFVLQRLGKDARTALLYALLLLPASITTIRTAGANSRELIAFALSGPLALAAFVALTSQLRAAPWLYRRILWVAVISVIGPLAVAVSNIRAELALRGSVEFRGESNFVTSGGFGPVQVSSALSLGILATVLLVISERERLVRILAGVIGVALMVQTLLTFSRGGSFSVAIAVAVLAVTQSGNRRIRNRIIAVSAISLVLANFAVFPWLESFTGGEFEERFSDTQSSRTELAANDTEIFIENPVMGVGPGMTRYQRLGWEVCQLRSDGCREEASSHTEFTRMLGEHGIPGALAIGAFSVLAFNAFRRAGPGRGFAIAWLGWTIAQMFYANLRIVAIPFAFGVAFMRWSEPRAPDDDEQLHDESSPSGAAHETRHPSWSTTPAPRRQRPLPLPARPDSAPPPSVSSPSGRPLPPPYSGNGAGPAPT